MFQTLPGIKKFFNDYKKNNDWATSLVNERFGIACSYEHLYLVGQYLKKSSWMIGAQDCSQYVQGAYTGQVSAQSLAELKVSFCIVGHTEVRQFLQQTNDQIARKFRLLIAANISPVLCIGETLAEKNAGMCLQVLYDQLEPIIPFLQSYHGPVSIFISYEPVYAIGTGFVPAINDLQDIFTFLNTIIDQLSAKPFITMLYGGSVSSLTVKPLRSIPEISGFLIGKASIDFQELKKIVDLQ